MVDANPRDPDVGDAAAGDTAAGDTASDDGLGLDQFESVADAPGISLDELSRAYAELINTGTDPYEPPGSTGGDAPQPTPTTDTAASDQDHCDLCPKSIVEAILFVGHPHNEPISGQQLAGLMRGVPPREVGELIAELNAEYRRLGHAFQLVKRDGGYRLELREEFTALRNAFYGRVREARLSQAVIDVLAIVAYQQGCTRLEIEKIRARPSGALLTQLVRRRLLRIERPDQKPRTPRYFVTERFLSLFGLDSIDELPQSHDVA